MTGMKTRYSSQSVANPTIGRTEYSLFKKLICSIMLLINLSIGVVGAHASEATAEIKVAVASNFLTAETELARAFEARTGYRVLTSSGSTGKLFAQIEQGAPFDIFLAADTVRPRKLIELGLAPQNSYFIYATGRLALWSPAAVSAEAVKAMLLKKHYKYLAIANPKTAPYGVAAMEAMQALDVTGNLVYGENIAQTWQFVETGHAELGFVALSQIIGRDSEGAYWPVPAKLHRPIRQGAVALGPGAEREPVRAFLKFLKSSEGRAIIASYGYGSD